MQGLSCRDKIGSDRKFACWVDVAVDEEDSDRGHSQYTARSILKCVCVCKR